MKTITDGKENFYLNPEHEEELKKGCGKEVTRGAYSFTCGEFSRAGKTQLCPECKAILCMEKRKNNKERT